MGLKERQEVLNRQKLILYKLFKENFQTEKYCEMNLTRSQRSLSSYSPLWDLEL